ncbi:MAG TPA: response regulator [Candidatus Binatia bacterium]|nr:response regulator [Candidatus Binatia bacterium]
MMKREAMTKEVLTQTRPPTVLVVDDNDGLVRLIQKALEREGFSAVAADSGKEAIQWLARNRAELMLLDLKLPDIEGKALVDHLAQIRRAVPFIVITGQGNERVAVDMMKSGALDYLVKDVDFIEFVPTVVRRALEQLEKDRRLAAAQAALEQSQKQVLTISEREQRRFGAELHDGLGQQLTAIELMCQALRADLGASRAELGTQVDQICRFLREAIGQTRALARGLSPVHLGSNGLAEALGELALRTTEIGCLKCLFDSSSPVVVEDNLVAGHLFRIAQEAVNNAVKHAQASEIVLRLSRSSNSLRLEISDNGRGLPGSPKRDQGMGLQVMQHRASVIGAELEMRSKPGKGVTVTCSLPARKR